MNNKDLIRQYVITGAILPKKQYDQLSNGDLKSYIKNRVIAHKQMINQSADYRFYVLTLDEYEISLKFAKSDPKGFSAPLEVYSPKNYSHLKIIEKYYPEAFNTLTNEELNNMSDFDLYQLLESKPDMIKRITDERVKQVKPGLIGYFIAANPKLIKLLSKEQLAGIDNYTMFRILVKGPHLLKLFKNKIMSIDDDWSFKRLAGEQPKLIEELISMNKLDIKDDSFHHTLMKTLGKTPKLTKDVPNQVFGHIADHSMMRTFQEYPNLMKVFPKEIINGMNEYTLRELIQLQPKAVKYITDNFSKMSSYGQSDFFGEFRVYGLDDDKKAELKKVYEKALPKMFQELEPYFKDWSTFEYGLVAKEHPKLIPLFIDNFSNYQISDMIKENPKLYKSLKDKSLISGTSIRDIIEDNPKTFKLFLDRIEDFGVVTLKQILNKFPNEVETLRPAINNLDEWETQHLKRNTDVEI